MVEPLPPAEILQEEAPSPPRRAILGFVLRQALAGLIVALALMALFILPALIMEGM